MRRGITKRRTEEVLNRIKDEVKDIPLWTTHSPVTQHGTKYSIPTVINIIPVGQSIDMKRAQINPFGPANDNANHHNNHQRMRRPLRNSNGPCMSTEFYTNLPEDMWNNKYFEGNASR